MKYIQSTFAVMLFLCLAHMPYGYYELVRIIAMILFGYMSVCYYNKENIPLSITFGGIALLFQPFFKIALGRTIWNIVDIVVALLLMFVILKERKE